MNCDQCRVLRHQLSLVTASLHNIAVERLINPTLRVGHDGPQPCNYKDNHEMRIKIYQDKAIRDKVKIYQLVERSRARALRMGQKIEFLLAEMQKKDELIAELMADEDYEESTAGEDTVEGACALLELQQRTS
jgi:hypothetical protein